MHRTGIELAIFLMSYELRGHPMVSMYELFKKKSRVLKAWIPKTSLLSANLESSYFSALQSVDVFDWKSGPQNPWGNSRGNFSVNPYKWFTCNILETGATWTIHMSCKELLQESYNWRPHKLQVNGQLTKSIPSQLAAVGSMPNYLAESSSVGSSKCLGMRELILPNGSCPISDEESTKTTNVSKAIHSHMPKNYRYPKINQAAMFLCIMYHYYNGYVCTPIYYVYGLCSSYLL